MSEKVRKEKKSKDNSPVARKKSNSKDKKTEGKQTSSHKNVRGVKVESTNSPNSSPSSSPSAKRRTPGQKRKAKGPQKVVLKQCVTKLNNAIQADPKTLQKYLIILGIGDPTIVRSTANLNVLLGEHLEKLKPCVNALTMTISSKPKLLSDELQQNSEYALHLFGALAERITLYDYFQRHPQRPEEIERQSIDHSKFTNK